MEPPARVDLEALKARLESVFAKQPSMVGAYLFGSAARGDALPDSDLDFAVLFRSSEVASPFLTVLWADLHDVLSPRDFDLVSLNSADPVLTFEVISEGFPLYWRSDDELNRFELRAWHRYQDTRPLRRIGDRYLEARAKEWSSSRRASESGSSF